ncbi:MAG: dethiobiotin synthase [Flavobacteriales bacterium]
MNIFVTGTGTDVGKTVVSAGLVRALSADYWKPIQAGDLEFTDTEQVKEWVDSDYVTYYPEKYRLIYPESPHSAAKKEEICISLNDFTLPSHSFKNLVIEGAGGIMVPLNDTPDTMADLILHLNAMVVLVSRNHLGSINQSLLTIEHLRMRNIPVLGMVFFGKPKRHTEEIILKYSDYPLLGRVTEEVKIDSSIIAQLANQFWRSLYSEEVKERFASLKMN